ncbi:MAG: hydrogenase [Desulfovibrionaceae bacterium]|jgi:hydrogenase-4 component B|nr:hydrogenase [Desulfovibrionaceae bacterium]
MTMPLLLLSILLCAVSGVPGLFAARASSGGEGAACGLTLAGCAAGTVGVCLGLVHGGETLLALPWAVPGGELALRLDGLAAIFLLPLFLVVGAASVYGLGYWPEREHRDCGRSLRLFSGLIAASMILLLLAQNAVLLLMAWEAMALTGFFLITAEHRSEDTRRAGYVYLAATHTGTLALFAAFVLLDGWTGSFLLPAPGALDAAGPMAATGAAVFLLALFGFGMKAGIMPLHVWLPGAHAAAPSHASAVLSGVMIKTGVYGLVRICSLFANAPAWWGWTVLGLGAASGILGVALALAQHDVKRLLAYHSVENIGIIVMGLGLALLGRAHGAPAMEALGLAGCLLHVVNHGLFKSLLFFSAGSVIHATGTRKIDRLGGLLRRMPWTGLFFAGGAVAISGLPPFNGFVSEWLVYLGAFQPLGLGAGPLTAASGSAPTDALLPAVIAAPALALIGGLALACFVKVFGIVFLGLARGPEAERGHEAGPAMLAPMAALLAACAWIGLLPATLAPLLRAAVAAWTGLSGGPDPLGLATIGTGTVAPGPQGALSPLGMVGAVGWLTILLCGLVWLWLRRRVVRAPARQGTWGCGYAFPTPRMQYTAASFADSLVRLFRPALRTRARLAPGGDAVQGLFPTRTAFSVHTPDAVLDLALAPACTRAADFFRRVRALVHNGVAASYLLYVALTVIALLAFVSGMGR